MSDRRIMEGRTDRAGKRMPVQAVCGVRPRGVWAMAREMEEVRAACDAALEAAGVPTETTRAGVVPHVAAEGWELLPAQGPGTGAGMGGNCNDWRVL